MQTRSKVAAGVGVVLLALASTFVPSPQGVQSIKVHEGVRTVAYLDAVQVPTICYGSTRKVYLGQRATLAQCEELLVQDLTYAGVGVAKHTRVKLTQGQYDALVSFVFNLGETQYRKSTLLRKLNAGDCFGAAAEFDRWVYAKGKRLKGLVVRRADERKLFERDCVLWVY
jgi:lysozyme